MKKFLCLALVLILSVSVFVACGNKEETPETDNTAVTTSDKSDNTSETPAEDKTPEDTTPSEKETPTQTEVINPSENSHNNTSFYLITNGTNEENILYHTENCPLLKDKEIQKTSWEMITMLQFRHCAKCNPPKYEGYVE